MIMKFKTEDEREFWKAIYLAAFKGGETGDRSKDAADYALSCYVSRWR